MNAGKTILFGSHSIDKAHVFYTSASCFGLVNLKPIAPGHVLVVSARPVARLKDLKAEEVADIMVSAQRIGAVVEKKYNGTSLTMAIQDGPQAGQTVPHVHMHIIPRKKGDYANNDGIYDDLDERKTSRVDNEERQPRSSEEMSMEAEELRGLFT